MMYYGHARHIPSEHDKTILHCGCGWHSKELTPADLHDLGIPWYCESCGKQNLRFVTFAPNERVDAYAVLGLDLPDVIKLVT